MALVSENRNVSTDCFIAKKVTCTQQNMIQRSHSLNVKLWISEIVVMPGFVSFLVSFVFSYVRPENTFTNLLSS